MDIEDIATHIIAKRRETGGSSPTKIIDWREHLERNPNESRLIRENLISWYLENRRKMPWRGDDTSFPITAYGVWISEVMLQQTRVETVVAYWNRWMAQFPTVETLSRATPEQVNTLWSGLGYYRRAQNLLLGAKFIMERCNGIIPTEKKLLLEVPGIGPYTAGAVLSIAYHQPEPLVDGNVIRVFSRLFCLHEELGASGNPLEKLCWKIAETLIKDESQASSYNQALMELGATICKPTNPDCHRCPIASSCKSRKLVELRMKDVKKYEMLPSEVSYFPLKKPKKKQKEIELLVNVIAEDVIDSNGLVHRKYLLLKRPEKGLLANQWEFPSIPFTSLSVPRKESDIDSNDEEEEMERDNILPLSRVLIDNREVISNFFLERCQAKILSASSERSGSDYVTSDISTLLEYQSSISLPDTIVHIFSHERHTMHIHITRVNSIPLESDSLPLTSGQFCWKTATEMKLMGITTGCKKILEKVEHALSTVSLPHTDMIDLVSPQKPGSTKNAFEVMKRASTSTIDNSTAKKKQRKGK